MEVSAAEAGGAGAGEQSSRGLVAEAAATSSSAAVVDAAAAAEDPLLKQHGQSSSQPQTSNHRQLTLLPLVALIYFEVSGGPFGVEDAVRHGGAPIFAIIGFLVFPFLWSLPEALTTAELATAFPEDSGYVAWVAGAFGPFWGFVEGWTSWLSGVCDNSLYPVLFLDYCAAPYPILLTWPIRPLLLAAITASLTLLNWRGLVVVGNTAVAVAAFSLLPFCLMIVLGLPRLEPARWWPESGFDWHMIEWGGFINILFWNLNYWDSAATLAGEVKDPGRTFPRALGVAVMLVMSVYTLPIGVGTAASSIPASEWRDGTFSRVAEELGSWPLRTWVIVAAAVSNIGLFSAEMSSDSFQLLGMAERGMLPAIFAKRSRHGTPTLAILCSASGIVLLSFLSFEQIVMLVNIWYCMAALLEYAALVWLRIKAPGMARPFKIPLSTTGVVLMVIPACGLIIFVMSVADLRTWLISTSALAFGIVFYYFLCLAKRRQWFEFAHAEYPLGYTAHDGDGRRRDAIVYAPQVDEDVIAHVEGEEDVGARLARAVGAEGQKPEEDGRDLEQQLLPKQGRGEQSEAQ
eukprot:jgi/Chlat1/3083/Chrsp21S03331